MNYKLIEEIKNQISITDVIGNFISLSKKGNNSLGICPFHDDKHASLTVSEQKKFFKCFSCNHSGDVFTFIKDYKNISYLNAVVQAAELSNVDRNLLNEINKLDTEHDKYSSLYAINNQAKQYFSLFLSNKENHHVIDYLNNRGINQEIIKYFEIGFAPDQPTIMLDLLSNKDDIVMGAKGYTLADIKTAGLANLLSSGDYLSFFRNRIIFPIHNEDKECVAFSGRTIKNEEPKYINTITTPIFNKNETLYNFNRVINQQNNSIETIYIVEGFMDVIALHKMQINNVVATMGVAFTKNHMTILSHLSDLKKVILCFDNDLAGQQNIEKTAAILNSKYDVYIVKYETDLKDIDEIYQHDSALAFKTVNNLVNFKTFQLHNLINSIEIKNDADKTLLTEKIVHLLSTYTNVVHQEEDLIYVVNALKIDERILRTLLQKITPVIQTRKYQQNLNKFEHHIELVNHQKPIIKTITKTGMIETQIIKTCLLSRQALELFFQKCGICLDSENTKLINLIDLFYLQNPDKQSIEIEDLPSMSQDLDIIATLSKLIINLKTMKTEYVQERLSKNIETLVSKIKKHEKDVLQAKLIGKKSFDEVLNILETYDVINSKK